MRPRKFWVLRVHETKKVLGFEGLGVECLAAFRGCGFQGEGFRGFRGLGF